MTQAGRNDAIVAQCASELAAAEQSRTPIEPLTARYPGLTVAHAYAVQRMNIARRLERGERIVGHKIGLTAKAMQEMFGVSEPDYGHLLDSMMHDAGRALDLAALIDPQVEVEPAFVLGRTLRGPGVGIAEVLAATDHIVVCLEVIDSRIVEWRIRLEDTVADNGSSARVVLGARHVDPAGLGLDDLSTELEVDGTVIERGNTGAILGHPANGIAWLANRLAEFGMALEPGHVVLPGTCTRSVRIGGRRHVLGRIASLGDVSLDLTGEPAIRTARDRRAARAD